MARLTIEASSSIKKEKEHHFDNIEKIYPSITKEEYDRWKIWDEI